MVEAGRSPGPGSRKWLAASAAIALLFVALTVATSAVVLTPGRAADSAASASPTATSGATESTDEPTVVRWFLSLTNSGGAMNPLENQKTLVSAYNKSNKDGITIKLEIAPNANAYDILKTEIAAGNAPDIVGPLGMKALNNFEGLFLDLSGEILRNGVDLSVYEPALVSYYRQGSDGQVALPYVMYPGYIWYNKDLFTKAGLPPLPTRVGELYQGHTWDWSAMGKIAAQLTLDSKGRDATDAAFDTANIVQYGMDFQWSDARRIASCFGGGSFVAPDGKTAQIPEAWGQAFNWYYDAIWKGHFIPTGAAETSTLLAQGNAQSSGRMAMNASWGWSIGTIWDSKTNTAKVKSWDIAVMPSWHGVVSSPIDMDSFFITDASKHPDAAFKAMLAIMSDQALMDWYGGLPARKDMQSHYLNATNATLASVFQGIRVTWSVLNEMSQYPAIPSHEGNMPNFTQASIDYVAALTRLQTKPGLDVQAELVALKKVLQADFDAVQPLN